MPPIVAPALALSILLAYAASIWWLLRGESRAALLWLAGLTGVCLALRLVYFGDYPAGFNEDEVKVLACTIHLYRIGALFAEDCTGLPALVSILFEAQLAEIIGPTAWAIRGYSMLGSVLAVPVGFAAARSLGLRTAPSLAFAGFLAVLPWSILYGRVHQSGDMVLHELFIVTALARFIRGFGGFVELGMAALSLCLLFYGYFSGRALLYLTVVAAVLARGRYRFFCLAIALIAFVGFQPYVQLSRSPHVYTGLSGRQVQGGYVENPIETLAHKTGQALHALVAPVAYDLWLTIRTGAMHPYLLLGLALIGSFTGWRRGLFLWAGFLVGLSPAVVGNSPLPSTRRMLMAFPFIALAAAAALDLIPWRRWRAPLCALVVLIVGVQSVRFYFSSEFWPPHSLWVFDAQRSRLVEAIPMPPHPRLVLSTGMGWYFAARAQYDKEFEHLAVDNWVPPDGQEVLYGFAQQFAHLAPLYGEVLGEARVQKFGGAFLVKVAGEDWPRLRSHGWDYEWSCDGGAARTTRVPTLFQVNFGFNGANCPGVTRHQWKGIWTGPASRLRFRFNGKAEIETQQGTILRAEGWQEPRDFTVAPGDELTIRVELQAGLEMLATLVQVTPEGERLPPFESVTFPSR